MSRCGDAHVHRSFHICMPVLQADGCSPRVNHFRIPRTGRSPRSRAKGPMQILPRRNRRSHRDLDRTPRSTCGNSGHRTIRRGTLKSPAKYASRLPARGLLEAQRRIRLRENLRLHHSVHKAPRDRILVHGRATAQVELLADALADALDFKDSQPEAASRFRERIAAHEIAQDLAFRGRQRSPFAPD